MKRILKASIAILLISAFLVPQNTLGVFQMEIGDKVAYKIVEACNDITVESTTDTFIGCTNDGTIISNGSTIVVDVTNVTATGLKWNTTNITPEMIGTYSTDLELNIFGTFIMSVYYFLSSGINIPEIISTGVIEPIYYRPFEIPIFVDPKPQTWIDFYQMEELFVTTIEGLFSYWDTCVVDSTYSEVNNKMTLTLWYDASEFVDVATNYSFDSTTSFSYNMTTGELLEADCHFSVTGSYMSAALAMYSDYNIEQTEVPSDPVTPNRFLEFLQENKWYFIGGGVGIVAIVATIGIVIGVKKSKGSKKSSKKKSSKKKK